MAFTPKKGYSAKRASTVFADGENNQRADFTYNLDSNWTTEKFSEDQSSLVFTNGENKQRATVVYNIGNSSGGGSSGGVTSVNGKTGVVTLTGNDINSTITGNGSDVTDTVTNHLQTLKNDQEANGTQIHEIEAKIPQSATETNQLTTKEDLPDSKAGTAGQVYTKTDTGAEWKTVSGSGTNAGIKGDYFATWGWMEGSNGLPTIVSGSNNIKIPAGTILMCPGSDGYITISGDTTFENNLTEDFTLFYARNLDGTGAGFIAATEVVWSDTEPKPNGQTGFQAWKKAGTSNWQLRSNDSGNVWREVVGTPISDNHYTDGSLTRLDFDGYRQFNKQEYLKTSGGVLTGPIIASEHAGAVYAGVDVLQLRADTDSVTGTPASIKVSPNGGMRIYGGSLVQFASSVAPTDNAQYDLGSPLTKWRYIYSTKLSNGADIDVPTTGGTMVVATPPTTAGNYVLKATVAEDGTVTTQWVAEA